MRQGGSIIPNYDEKLLMLRLGRLDRGAKTAFAAACAQRLLPLSDRYALQEGAGSARLERLNVIVSALWEAAAGKAIDAQQMAKEAESMVPDEDDEGWTADRAYAGNAAAAACYALRTWLTDDPQESTWAARQLFDAADLAYFQAVPGGSILTGEEERESLMSSVVQSAISAIQRDLDAVENATPYLDLRRRVEAEAKDWAATIP